MATSFKDYLAGIQKELTPEQLELLYNRLKCDIRHLSTASDEYRRIQKLLRRDQRLEEKKGYTFEVQDVFRLNNGAYNLEDETHYFWAGLHISRVAAALIKFKLPKGSIVSSDAFSACDLAGLFETHKLHVQDQGCIFLVQIDDYKDSFTSDPSTCAGAFGPLCPKPDKARLTHIVRIRGKRFDGRPMSTRKRKAESAESSEKDSGVPSDRKPACRYGEKCYRKNPDHLRDFSHPHRPS